MIYYPEKKKKKKKLHLGCNSKSKPGSSMAEPSDTTCQMSADQPTPNRKLVFFFF